MPHVLIKYAHVLICILAGEGSQHFSAISLRWLNLTNNYKHTQGSMCCVSSYCIHSKLHLIGLWLIGTAGNGLAVSIAPLS